MTNGVFDQRLENHAGNDHIQSFRINLLADPELVPPEAHDFNIEVVVDEVKLLLERDKMHLRLEPPAEDVRKFQDDRPGRIRIDAYQGRDGVQRIEEKMRVDLADQGIHASLHQGPLLFLEFPLDACVVPDAHR